MRSNTSNESGQAVAPPPTEEKATGGPDEGPVPAPNASSPEEPPISPTANEILRAFLMALFKMLFGIRYIGRENIPASGPAIIAPNHVSYLDPIIAGVGVMRRLRAMAWDRLFHIPLLGAGIRWLGAFPVRPESADSDAYKQCLAILRRGGIVQIFPEGKRGFGQSLLPFLPGVARLAARTGAVIVPTTLTGTLEAWPRWRAIPLPRWRITVKYHRPIHPPPGPLKGPELQRAIEEMNERLVQAIRRRLAAYERALRRRGRTLPSPPSGTKG